MMQRTVRRSALLVFSAAPGQHALQRVLSESILGRARPCRRCLSTSILRKLRWLTSILLDHQHGTLSVVNGKALIT